jgi:hypothetical protein
MLQRRTGIPVGAADGVADLDERACWEGPGGLPVIDPPAHRPHQSNGSKIMRAREAAKIIASGAPTVPNALQNSNETPPEAPLCDTAKRRGG